MTAHNQLNSEHNLHINLNMGRLVPLSFNGFDRDF